MASEKYSNLEILIDISNEEEGAIEVLKVVRPKWNLDNLKIKHYSEGITNKLFSCSVKDDPDDVVMFRIYGENTEIIIDREAEKKTFLKLSKVGCSPPLYCIFQNGIAYGFLKGRTLGLNMVSNERIYRLVAKEMVKIHSLDINSNQKPNAFLYQKIENFISVLPSSFDDPKQQKRFQDNLPNKEKIVSELSELKSHIDELNSPVVFCHNDLLLNNIIYNEKEGTLGFIDYEYAFHNFQAYEIGDHFCEFAGVDEVNYDLYPDKEFQLKWLKVYLEYWFEAINRNASEVTSCDVLKLYVQVNKCALAAHFLWGIWAIIQAKNSNIDFDYLEYAQIRFDEYFKRKQEFLSLTLV